MKKQLNEFTDKLQKGARKNAPKILIAMGITSMIGGTVSAIFATSKAKDILEDEINYRNTKLEDGHEEIKAICKLEIKEVFKLTWKLYIPSILATTTGAMCIIYADKINANRSAALATAYSISERAYSKYRSKVIDTFGEDKEKEIRNKVYQDQIKENPPTQQVIISSGGDQLFCEMSTGQYFKSDMNEVKRIENELNRRMLNEMYISLSELLDEFKLKHTAISDELGWNINNGMIEFDYSTHITDDGRSCIAVGYHYPPRYEFNKIF